MADYVDPAEAREMPGMRLALSRGVPGPWGEAAKAILHTKGIPFVRVAQLPGGNNDALREWTGHDNAPIAVYGSETPVTGWAEILFLAERVGPEPSLVPEAPSERALHFGLARELCGELGLAWCRRLELIDGAMRLPEPPPLTRYLAERYGYTRELGARAPLRVAGIVRLLDERLAMSREAGNRYLMGEALSALDLYWATFAAIVAPLPQDLCPMHAPVRQAYTARHPAIVEALSPELLAHRDFVYREHLELPVDF